MDCCFKILFLLIILCVQLLFSDPILAANLQINNENDSSLILDDKIDEQSPLFSDKLFAGGKAEGIPEGNDLILGGNGEINLTHGKLQFEVCKDCDGTSSVCFDTFESVFKSEVICSGFPSYCNFQVKKDDDYIYFGIIAVSKDKFDGFCAQPIMHTGRVSVFGNIDIKSCEPKIDGVDKIIKLFVDIDPLCSIRVLNAKVHVPEIPSTPAPSASSPSSNTTDPSWTASFPWWLIFIIVIVGIAVILGICGFVQKKKDKKKKKQQTTHEPSTTNEDAQAPHVTVPPAPVQSNPAPFIPYPKRIYARNYPGNTHVVAKSKVDLLCSPVSKMFSSINDLA
uniref:Uncharacterized protein n=1 Tax=Panagrolaimus sp. ES5 TaxID=591445 RepID=A0AC34FR84_9BILA